MVETLVVLDPLADLARFEGVPSAVAAATDAVDAVLRDRGLRKITDEQLSQALLAGARANAELTGDPARWQIGALRLSAELASLAALIRVAPAQALARAHARGRSWRGARQRARQDQLGAGDGGTHEQPWRVADPPYIGAGDRRRGHCTCRDRCGGALRLRPVA